MSKIEIRCPDDLVESVRTKLPPDQNLSSLVRTLLMQWMNAQQAVPLVPETPKDPPRPKLPAKTLAKSVGMTPASQLDSKVFDKSHRQHKFKRLGLDPRQAWCSDCQVKFELPA